MAFGSDAFKGSFSGPYAGTFGDAGLMGPPPVPAPTLYVNSLLTGGDADSKTPPTAHTFPFTTGSVEVETHPNGESQVWTTSGTQERIFFQYVLQNNNPDLELGAEYEISVEITCFEGLTTNAIAITGTSNIEITEQDRQVPVGQRRRVYIRFIPSPGYTGNFRFGTGITTTRSETYKSFEPRLIKITDAPPTEPPEWDEDIPDITVNDVDGPINYNFGDSVSGASSYENLSDPDITMLGTVLRMTLDDTPRSSSAQVKALNFAGDTDSNIATWTITGTAPIPTEHPDDLELDEEGSGNFSGEGTHAATTVEYLWQAEATAGQGDFDSVYNTLESDVVQGTAPTMTITSAHVADDGKALRLMLRAYGAWSGPTVSYTDTALFTVNTVATAPVWTDNLPDRLGEDTILPHSIDLDDYCDGATSYDIAGSDSNFELNGSIVGLPRPVSSPGAKELTVIASNDQGDTPAPNVAEWEVIGTNPQITTQPTDTTIEEGGTGQFSVEATHLGDAPLHYSWQVWNGSSWSGSLEDWIESDFSGNSTDTLTLSNASEEDNDKDFRCRLRAYGAQSSAQQIYSSEVTLTVEAVDIPEGFYLVTYDLRNESPSNLQGWHEEFDQGACRPEHPVFEGFYRNGGWVELDTIEPLLLPGDLAEVEIPERGELYTLEYMNNTILRVLDSSLAGWIGSNVGNSFLHKFELVDDYINASLTVGEDGTRIGFVNNVLGTGFVGEMDPILVDGLYSNKGSTNTWIYTEEGDGYDYSDCPVIELYIFGVGKFSIQQESSQPNDVWRYSSVDPELSDWFDNNIGAEVEVAMRFTGRELREGYTLTPADIGSNYNGYWNTVPESDLVPDTVGEWTLERWRVPHSPSGPQNFNVAGPNRIPGVSRIKVTGDHGEMVYVCEEEPNTWRFSAEANTPEAIQLAQDVQAAVDAGADLTFDMEVDTSITHNMVVGKAGADSGFDAWAGYGSLNPENLIRFQALSDGASLRIQRDTVIPEGGYCMVSTPSLPDEEPLRMEKHTSINEAYVVWTETPYSRLLADADEDDIILWHFEEFLPPIDEAEPFEWEMDFGGDTELYHNSDWNWFSLRGEDSQGRDWQTEYEAIPSVPPGGGIGDSMYGNPGSNEWITDVYSELVPNPDGVGTVYYAIQINAPDGTGRNSLAVQFGDPSEDIPKTSQLYHRYRVRLGEAYGDNGLGSMPDYWLDWFMMGEWFMNANGGGQNSRFSWGPKRRANDGPLTWHLTMAQTPPGGSEENILQAQNPDATVPILEWFLLEFIWVEGDDETGRFWLQITPDSTGTPEVVFDLTTRTISEYEPSHMADVMWIKSYTHGNVIDWATANGTPVEFWIEDVYLTNVLPEGFK